LENTLRRAVVHNQGDLLTADGVAEAMLETVKSGLQSGSSAIKLLDEVEKEHILNALKFAGGNRGRVCELLGISRPTLQRKIRKYQIRL
jgi:transcriptional regulator with PAS, ATPase and Fis domain